jgi:hypothetical protein
LIAGEPDTGFGNSAVRQFCSDLHLFAGVLPAAAAVEQDSEADAVHRIVWLEFGSGAEAEFLPAKITKSRHLIGSLFVFADESFLGDDEGLTEEDHSADHSRCSGEGEQGKLKRTRIIPVFEEFEGHVESWQRGHSAEERSEHESICESANCEPPQPRL